MPAVKTLEQFDWSCAVAPEGPDPGAGYLAFVQRAENVVLLGLTGVGETHIALALGQRAVPLLGECWVRRLRGFRNHRRCLSSLLHDPVA